MGPRVTANVDESAMNAQGSHIVRNVFLGDSVPSVSSIAPSVVWIYSVIKILGSALRVVGMAITQMEMTAYCVQIIAPDVLTVAIAPDAFWDTSDLSVKNPVRMAAKVISVIK